ncbi:MAG: radical SAM protein, partial [Terriglobales bacterium]
MALDLTQHPCFNSDVRHRTGRIHLPVAPRCNIQCNYCDRKFDCANESRPAVTSSVLSPREAMAYLDRALEKTPYLKVVGIAGPGDPFANPEETMETLRLVREKYPEMLLCVATNGLNVEPYVAELTQLQVSHVTFTVNAVDPEIGAQIYAWVRDGRAIYRNEAGASLLWERQKQAIAALKNNGVIVKINTIVVPGINDTHTEDVAIEMRALGADIMNCIPLYPVKDTPFEDREQLGAEPIRRLRKTVQAYLPQMKHCTRCRADAVGLLGEPPRDELVTLMRACADGTFDNELANPDRAYVAVASMEGFLVNQHLGEATRLWVFGPGDPNPRLIDTRATPEPG